MTNSSTHFKAGTRGSSLALRQTRNALNQCERCLPGIRFELVPVDTPGDRDRTTDLRVSPENFFSKDLDDALRNRALDCALHSAKDLPETSPTDIDRFWLPWREDPRDAIIRPDAGTTDGTPRTEIPDNRALRIGVSSDRRETFCRQRFPNAELTSVRGNIEDRLRQLDNGDFDLLIMAAAALHRLELAHRISEYIPLHDLPVPEGQGVLAMTFRSDDHRLIALRNLLIHPVILAGAGIGAAENATQAVVDALRSCDVCLHDALLPEELLDNLPPTARSIPVGKRAGQHSVPQDKICALLLDHAKKGRRVLRLKGGDPAVFGRLAEEVGALQAEKIPFRVLPGLGALSVAAASTGILPSRRNTARGFSVLTPRKAGEKTFAPVRPDERLRIPQVFYMGTGVVAQLAQQYLDEGFPGGTPVALVFDAGGDDEQVVHRTLASVSTDPPPRPDGAPGLVFIGDVANPEHTFHTHAPLEGKRVLYCGAKHGVAKARRAVQRFGGKCIARPMIQLEINDEARSWVPAAPEFDDILITSPACARLFLDAWTENVLDLRSIPRLLLCGPGTAAVFEERGIVPDIVPERAFGAEGLNEELARLDLEGRKLLRLRSDKGTPAVAEELRSRGACVEDVEFYRNRALTYDHIPEADAVVFTSASSVKAFLQNASAKVLNNKLACAIGKPTADALEQSAQIRNPLIPPECTIPSCIQAIAGAYTVSKMTAL
ncbi:MAG: hydroxymethylbilane synthase [Verrucomicrobiota bacterium]